MYQKMYDMTTQESARPAIKDGVILTEEWLKRVGFKWHQLDRQPDKHWLLWLGSRPSHDLL